jgi:hypothetical protein
VRVRFAYDGGGLGKGGTVTFFTGETQIGEGHVGRMLPFMFSTDETVDVGSDLPSPVSDDCRERFTDWCRSSKTGAERWRLTR